ncbi:Na+/H+ antiporter subunit E [Alkalilimnicola sp. S0819]|uniref:Na+/H+ antiporter subunit E n=1 Tax=Alkalilimnicola sp. S0819 TaxID=2613922 RepID=UPI001261623B|nr:Na+/H+ antiporter subunit E [Alkalilimnicola sp. S0819]KAB7627483.1 Na+/H+ antiporter subunit E [Alkalilimnicola sp. S0819]MPQ15635.1 cation transporter [Alkalilimnicola sp. S0819]
MPMHSRGRRRPRSQLAHCLIRRGALYTPLWFALSGAPAGNWPYGMMAVGATLGLSLALLPPGHTPAHTQTSGWRLLRFLPWFAYASLRAGFDVARRAFSPGPPLNPGLLEVKLPQAPGARRVVLAGLLTLLPGTLAADFTEGGLKLHVLDRARDNRGNILALAHRLYGAAREPR